MSLVRSDIEGLLPHRGTMVLLDRVVEWNTNRIICTTETHLRPDNPLRRDGELAAAAGIEISAQAMALHGGLTSSGRVRSARLGSLREVQWRCRTLSAIGEPLTVTAMYLGGGQHACMYAFRIEASGQLVIAGRAGVFFT